MNEASKSVDHDMVGRLTTTDTQMMYKCSKWELSHENDMNGTLCSTPQDNKFMTEKNMKKIIMPKRIEF